jgi:hypothetical protein
MSSLMKAGMEQARRQLAELLETHEATAGMYVRVHGAHLIIGRAEESAPENEEPGDRVRLTRLSAKTFGLSVKRHTGRWEKTPFSGTMSDVVNAILSFMRHLVAAY